MSLTAEQQAQLDIQLQIETTRHTNLMALEADRVASQVAADARRAKLEAVRMAKETLTENARTKPVDSREITANDITAFAQTIVDYVNN